MAFTTIAGRDETGKTATVKVTYKTADAIDAARIAGAKIVIITGSIKEPTGFARVERLSKTNMSANRSNTRVVWGCFTDGNAAET